MKTADQWFSEYAESHQNATNKLIHWICVPLIFYSIIGLIACLPHEGLAAEFPEQMREWVHFGSVFLTLGSLFYLRLSPRLFIGLVLFSALCLWVINVIENSSVSLLWSSLIIFVAAWIGQFWGHKIEGKKPSFFKDLQFLLIGPAWLMHFIYKSLGLKY